jgi:O-antigen biosynthesis protein
VKRVEEFPKATNPRRITLVTDEMLGCVRCGGMGTAHTFIALALARMGHRVEFLYLGEQPTEQLASEWADLYAKAGVGIRPLPSCGEAVAPPYFAQTREAERALRADPPEVVITQDLFAPAYAALRLRNLGLAFENTRFVVRCAGTRRWITDASRKVRVLPGALGVTVLEQACAELADVLVSPSVYMTEWMRAQGWRLPARTVVIPNLTRSDVTGEPSPEPVPRALNERVQRLVFFGRLEERKGLRPFAAGLNALERALLEGLELEFVGRETPAWSPGRVEALLSESTRQALASVSFYTRLDQPEALARLSRPGTLVVLPSLEDNSPNTVSECLESGIPFIASARGGTADIVAPADRGRVLVDPTPEGIAAALRRVLSGSDALRPATPAADPQDSLGAWAEVIENASARPQPRADRPAVDVIVVHRGSADAVCRCLAALARQSYDDFRVILAAVGTTPAEALPADSLARCLVVRCEGGSVAAARAVGLGAAGSEWVVFLDEEDVPEPELLDVLVRAQAASGADVVSCGLYLEQEGGRTLRFFPGQAQGLGLLENGYGTVALLRRALLGELATAWPVEGDPDWPLLARLSASGARIVSVPAPLLTRRTRPGTLEQHPSDALLVLDQFERALPDQARSLARLAAGLAANSYQSGPQPHSNGARRALQRLARSRRYGPAPS